MSKKSRKHHKPTEAVFDDEKDLELTHDHLVVCDAKKPLNLAGIKGGRDEAFRFIDSLKIFSLLANVADVKSLVIHPASTTHSQLTDEELEAQGITQSTIRLSIGTEHIDDIIEDLSQAFEAALNK